MVDGWPMPRAMPKAQAWLIRWAAVAGLASSTGIAISKSRRALHELSRR